ncbi:MAG: transglycosylase SLT domain-containing protein [bacterium]
MNVEFNSLQKQDLHDFQIEKNDLGKTGVQKHSHGSLRKAAQNFEAFFLTQLLQTMRKSIPNSNLFGKGQSGDIYKSLFDEKIAEAVASKGGIGLADIIIEDLQRNDERQTPASGQSLLDYRQLSRWNRPAPGAHENWDRSVIAEAANRFDVAPKLIEAIIRVESNYRVTAVSPKGAAGLMQLMESTAHEMGVSDRMNPTENIYGGVKYFKSLLDRFHGKLELALSAYNAGPAAVEKYNGVPPYPETQRYVKKVLEIYQEL